MAQLIPVLSASGLEARDKAERDAAEARQNTPMIQSLAAHARKRWELMRDNRSVIEERMLSCLRQRNGEYDPEKLAAIREQGGSEIFMNLTSVKCRAASAWLRDTLMGTGSDKPWELTATPIPDLPPDVVAQLHAQLTQQVMGFIQANGVPPPEEQVRQMAQQMKDQVSRQMDDEAAKRVDRMEEKFEDQLAEGGFRDAFSAFVDDLATFPFAVLKGPVMRKRKVMEWAGNGLLPVEKMREEWYRVDPFLFYWAPWCSAPNDGPLIELHKLTRQDLESLDGVEGYDSAAIRIVLEKFDGGGLRDWISNQSSAVAQATAEGKTPDAVNEADLVYAVQLWDTVTGKMLKEWGVEGIQDETKSYSAEIWLVENVVIRAVLNYDPLGRKPYFMTSYEKVPGQMAGNGVADLVRNPQQMCNAAARALSNNMGISSGPQVGVNVSRLPPGEKITSMYPWKMWQFQNTDYQDSSAPLTFFQPQSNAAELMAVFEKYSVLADEYSGIPRYMQGEHQAGVGRTSSGLAMLMGNASKGMKQVVNNIDTDALQPMLERLYEHNLRYSADPDLIGDVRVVAKGAASLVARETAAVRRNEFLQLVLNSPVVTQIVGMPGLAELLRDAAKPLQMNIDRILPTREQVEQQQVAQQQREQQMQDMMLQAALNPEMETVDFKRDQTGAITGATKKKPKALLPDGSVAGGRQSNLNVNRVTGANA